MRNTAQSIRGHCGEHHKNQYTYVYHYDTQKGGQQLISPDYVANRVKLGKGRSVMRQPRIQDYLLQHSQPTSTQSNEVEVISEAEHESVCNEPGEQRAVAQSTSFEVGMSGGSDGAGVLFSGNPSKGKAAGPEILSKPAPYEVGRVAQQIVQKREVRVPTWAPFMKVKDAPASTARSEVRPQSECGQLAKYPVARKECAKLTPQETTFAAYLLRSLGAEEEEDPLG